MFSPARSPGGAPRTSPPPGRFVVEYLVEAPDAEVCPPRGAGRLSPTAEQGPADVRRGRSPPVTVPPTPPPLAGRGSRPGHLPGADGGDPGGAGAGRPHPGGGGGEGGVDAARRGRRGVERRDQLRRRVGGRGAHAAHQRRVRQLVHPVRGQGEGPDPGPGGHGPIPGPQVRDGGPPRAPRRAPRAAAHDGAQAHGPERGRACGDGVPVRPGRDRHRQGRPRARQPALGALQGAGPEVRRGGGPGQRRDGAELPLLPVPERPGAPGAGTGVLRQAAWVRGRADAPRHHGL